MKKLLLLFFCQLWVINTFSQVVQATFASQGLRPAQYDTAVKKAPRKQTYRNPQQPKYGQEDVELTAEDEFFFATCEQNFGNRIDASQFFSARAWEYLAEGQADTAMHRFNLAWLLNNNNIDSYWGWGVLAYQQGKLDDAIVNLEKGLTLKPNNVTLMVDLATVYIRYYQEKEDKTQLQTAFEYLNKAIEIEPTFANAYMKLSLAEFSKGELDKAWWSFHKGYELAPEETDIEYLRQLLSKKQDPQGKFKE